MKRGIPLGISVVEPIGDVAAMVAEICKEMEIPCIHVDPDNPDYVGEMFGRGVRE